MSEKTIAMMLTGLSEVYGGGLSEAALEIYIDLLEPYGVERVRQAVNSIVRTRKYSTFPTPAEFIEHIDPPEQQSVTANRAYRRVEHAFEIAGYYQSVEFDDPCITQAILAMGGWMDFYNRCFGQDWHFVQKEFERRYSEYRKMPHVHNEILIGYVDKTNQEPNPKPTRIECSWIDDKPKAIKAPVDSDVSALIDGIGEDMK